MRDEVDPLSWSVSYPLGAIARLYLNGDHDALRVEVDKYKALNFEPHEGSYCRSSTKQTYSTDEYLVGQRVRLADEGLLPLWVADWAIRRGVASSPAIALHALDVFVGKLKDVNHD